MKTELKKVISLAAAVTIAFSSAAGSGLFTAHAPKALRPAPLSAQALGATTADPGAAALERLTEAAQSGDSAGVTSACDELLSLLDQESKVSSQPYDDPELEELRQSYLSQVAVRAARARNAIEAYRTGSGSQEDLEALRDAFAERAGSHKSDAVPSVAAENASPQLIEGRLTAQEEAPASDAPTEEDLAFASDTQIPDSVVSMAKELGSAKEIYKFVKDNVRYESYSGSKKGAMVTLDQMGGNDIDQACLLISMLRAIGVPARYVSGTVQLSADQAVEITGAADIESAGRILASRYKNVKGVTNNGILEGYRMDQVWAEAYVPYTDYRGAGSKAGDSVWVPLDASFKALDVTSREMPLEYTDKDREIIGDTLSHTSEYPVMYQRDYSVPETLEVFTRLIRESEDIYLPSSLPYETVQVKGRWSVLPDEMKDSITVQIGGEVLLDALLPELYYKQITVSFEPAGDSDRELLEQAGDITKAPAYMIQMVPVVTVKDHQSEDKYTGTKPVSLGMADRMLTTVTNEGGTTILDDEILSGSVYAINLDYQIIMQGDMQFSLARLKAAQNDVTAENSLSPEILGAILDYTGKNYFAYCDREALVYETVYNVDRNRQLGLCITGYEFGTDDELGVITSLTTGSFFMDAAYNNYSAVSYSGSQEDEISFNMALGASESFYEGHIWEMLTDSELRGISTVSVFAAAAEQNVPVRYICGPDFEDSLALCTVSEEVKEEVRNFVNKGMAVQLVADTMTIGDWTGTAYIAVDLRTGACSYMLSGGTAGGHTVSFDYLYKVNMMLFQMNLCLGAVKLTESFFKIHMEDPCNVFSGAVTAINTGKALGNAFTMYYETIDFIFDYAMEGDDMLDRFKEFTKQNIQNTIDYVKSIFHDAVSDIVSNTFSFSVKVLEDLGSDASEVVDIVGESVSTVQTVGETSYELGEGIGSGDVYDEDWLNDFNMNCYASVMDKILNLLGRMFG
ncbi:MAG: transglutaminase domain-containing protein [Ruminococcus sp.]|nr:transglutaminase domain-containing protein [Ruminococcus sp.]